MLALGEIKRWEWVEAREARAGALEASSDPIEGRASNVLVGFFSLWRAR